MSDSDLARRVATRGTACAALEARGECGYAARVDVLICGKGVGVRTRQAVEVLAVCLYHKSKLILESHTLFFKSFIPDSHFVPVRGLIRGIRDPYWSNGILVCSGPVARSQAAKTKEDDPKP